LILKLTFLPDKKLFSPSSIGVIMPVPIRRRILAEIISPSSQTLRELRSE
jgi:hypothetical protein